jgi:hypothetical protein
LTLGGGVEVLLGLLKSRIDTGRYSRNATDGGTSLLGSQISTNCLAGTSLRFAWAGTLHLHLSVLSQASGCTDGSTGSCCG